MWHHDSDTRLLHQLVDYLELGIGRTSSYIENVVEKTIVPSSLQLINLEFHNVAQKCRILICERCAAHQGVTKMGDGKSAVMFWHNVGGTQYESCPASDIIKTFELTDGILPVGTGVNVFAYPPAYPSAYGEPTRVAPTREALVMRVTALRTLVRDFEETRYATVAEMRSNPDHSSVESITIRKPFLTWLKEKVQAALSAEKPEGKP